jgi:hypothetical protein
MESGTVSKDKGLGLDNRIASSPLIMLATQLNSKAEIQERTIPVSINNSKRDESHAVAFRQARNNPQHLIAVARAAMETTLELDMAWVVEALARCHEEMPPKLQNRIGVNWEFALLGLEYFSVILTRQAAPQDILDSVSGLRGFLLNYLFVNEVELSSASDIQEVDSVIDTFGEIVVQDAGSRNRKFIHGEHYFVIGDTLHIWSAVFFPQYLWHCRHVLMTAPEMSTIRQFQDLIKHQTYLLECLPPNEARSPSGWHSLHIPGLKLRRIRTDNFLVD